MDLYKYLSIKEKACNLSDPACIYHPDLPKNLHLFGGINTEVCISDIFINYPDSIFLDLRGKLSILEYVKTYY